MSPLLSFMKEDKASLSTSSSTFAPTVIYLYAQNREMKEKNNNKSTLFDLSKFINSQLFAELELSVNMRHFEKYCVFPAFCKMRSLRGAKFVSRSSI